MHANLLLSLVAASALLLAGCTSPEPAEDGRGADDDPAPAGLPPNQEGGNASAPAPSNETGGEESPAAADPVTVHQATYGWAGTPPSEGTFTVDRPFLRLTVTATQDGPGVGNLRLLLFDPRGVDAGEVAVSAQPGGGVTVSTAVTSAEGAWTLRPAGQGVGTLSVEVVAT